MLNHPESVIINLLQRFFALFAPGGYNNINAIAVYQGISLLNRIMARLKLRVFFLPFLLISGGISNLMAQMPAMNLNPDTVPGIYFLRCEVDSLFSIHDELINGKLYTNVPDKSEHPFFQGGSWTSGRVFFSDGYSSDEIMRYDLATDNLIILHNTSGTTWPVVLSRNTVNGFNIGDSHFVLLNADKITAEGFVTGYYEKIYGGKTGLFARWTKERSVNKETLRTEFSEKLKCYLWKDSTYSEVRNNHIFRKLLSDRESQVRSFMKSNRIRFSPAKAKSAAGVLEYYDTLHEK